MNDLGNDHANRLAGPAWCRSLGKATIDGFLAFISNQAGDSLSIDQLRKLARRFNDDPTIMADRYSELWRAAGWSRRGDDTPDRRSAPLQRLLVERFEHLLSPPGSDIQSLPDGTPAIPRASIGGILAAMATMAPGNLWDLARRRCVDVVAGLRQQMGADFRWDQVQANADVAKLVDDVRMAVLPYFEDFEKRRRWFLAVVDRHQPELGWADAHGQPVTHLDLLDEYGFDRVFAALFGDLVDRIRDRQARAKLLDQYGPSALASLDSLTAHLPGLKREPALD